MTTETDAERNFRRELENTIGYRRIWANVPDAEREDLCILYMLARDWGIAEILKPEDDAVILRRLLVWDCPESAKATQRLLRDRALECVERIIGDEVWHHARERMFSREIEDANRADYERHYGGAS